MVAQGRAWVGTAGGGCWVGGGRVGVLVCAYEYVDRLIIKRIENLRHEYLDSQCEYEWLGR